MPRRQAEDFWVVIINTAAINIKTCVWIYIYRYLFIYLFISVRIWAHWKAAFVQTVRASRFWLLPQIEELKILPALKYLTLYLPILNLSYFGVTCSKPHIEPRAMSMQTQFTLATETIIQKPPAGNGSDGKKSQCFGMVITPYYNNKKLSNKKLESKMGV